MNKLKMFECYNAIPFGVCVFDKHLEVLYVNHVFQCTLENNYINKKITELSQIFPIFNDEYFKIRLEMLFQLKTPIFLSSVLHNSLHIKEEASYNLSFYPHINPDNNEISAILTIEEVTDLMNQIKLQENLLTKLDIELKRTKEAKAQLLKSETLLREANEAKNNLFSIIAHDLKSPFNALWDRSRCGNAKWGRRRG